MKNSVKFLTSIEDAMQMGMLAIDSIKDQIQDDELKQLATSQHEEYAIMLGKVGEQLVKNGEQIKKSNKVVDGMLTAMTKMRTLVNSSNSSIAEMFVEGSNAGIIEMHKLINEYENKVDSEISRLAYEVISFEQNNIQQMVQYL